MAGIIKSGQLHEGPSGAQMASFNFEDMSHKADTYLEAIRRQAAQILVTAKEQAKTIEDQARERGRQAALQEAEQLVHAQLEKRVETLLPALGKSIDSIRHARESWLRHWETNTVRLSIAIAERVIRRELAKSPEISLTWIREALELVMGEGRITLHLHPDDLETLADRAQLLVERLSPLGTSKVLADPKVERGGCRVETEFGSIDQQLSSQLERIAEEFGSKDEW